MSVVDVLVAFVTFEDTGTELVVEAVSVFGPRETVGLPSNMSRNRPLTFRKKPVYSQSDFDVYRKVRGHSTILARG